MNSFWVNFVIGQALSVLTALASQPNSTTARKVRPVVLEIWHKAGEFLRNVPE